MKKTWYIVGVVSIFSMLLVRLSADNHGGGEGDMKKMEGGMMEGEKVEGEKMMEGGKMMEGKMMGGKMMGGKKNKSMMRRAYIQSYDGGYKVRLMVSDQLSMDVILAGLDGLMMNWTSDGYWELMSQLLYQKTPLMYREVGKDKRTGLMKVRLYMGKMNLNRWLYKNAMVKYFPMVKTEMPRWRSMRGTTLSMSSRVWVNRGRDKGRYSVWLDDMMMGKKKKLWGSKKMGKEMMGKEMMDKKSMDQ